MNTRRGFLGSILAAGIAPAFVGSSVLMPVRKIVTLPSPITFPVPSANWGTLIDGNLLVGGSLRATEIHYYVPLYHADGRTDFVRVGV